MRFKSIILLGVILLSLLCISSASAEDVDLQTNQTDLTIGNEITDIIEEKKYDPGISSQDLVKYYRNDSQFDVTIIGDDGKPVDSGIDVKFTIKTKTYTLQTNEKGIATLNINLIPGNYEIKTIYGDYVAVNTIKVLPPVVTGDLVKYYKNSSNFEAKILGDHGTPVANAKVTFKVKTATYVRYTNNNGVASLPIGLNPGKYQMTTKYGAYSVVNNINVLSPIVTNDLVKYYRNDSQFKSMVLGVDKNPNAKVSFTIKGKTYNINTDENGVATLAINLSPGTYTINTKYEGFSVKNNIKVLPPVITNNLVKYYKNGSNFDVKIMGDHGVGLANAKVTFKVKTATYVRYTNNNGVASLPIGLSPGSYTINTKYGAYSFNNNIKVMYNVATNDLVKYYKNGTHFTVKILDGNDNPVNGAKVRCIFNGKTLPEAKTGENGKVVLIINSEPGTYYITTTCGLNTVKNTITVLEPFESNNLVKYYKNESQFDVKVLDSKGNPVAEGVNVDITVRGKTYTIQTNENGIATLPINLSPGTYELTTSYNGYSVKNTVKVFARFIKVTGDVSSLINDSAIFKIKVLDKHGNLLKNENVTFTVNGNTYVNPTDENGIATLNTSLNAGIYTLNYTVDGISETNKITFKNLVTMQILNWGTGGDITKNKAIKANLPKSDLVNKIVQAAKSGTPLLTFKGAGEGKTIFMNSGTHGNEISSQVAMLKMISKLETTPINGTVYVMPFICPKITEQNIRRYNNDDMNRVAHITGKVSNKVLNLMISLNCEAYGDFHCTQSPGVPGKDVIMGCASPTTETLDMIHEVARLSGFPTIIYEKATKPYLGAIGDHANIAGIPSITCEVVSVPGQMNAGSDVKSLKQITAYLTYNGIIN